MSDLDLLGTRRSRASNDMQQPTPAQQQRTRVAFVGVGPGDPALITLRCRDLIAAADVLVLDQLGREELIAPHARPDVLVIDAGHGDHGEQLTTASRVRLLVEATRRAPEGSLIVRLMDGDPVLFTGFSEEAKALHKIGVTYDVVPGVSAVTAVPAFAGIPLTSSDAPAVHVLYAGHEPRHWGPSTEPDVTVVVLGAPDRLGDTLVALREAGRAPDTPVALIESGGASSQRSRVMTLEDVEDTLSRVTIEFPAMAVVGPTVALRDQLTWFESKPLFAWQVLVPRTKEQSAATVERLRSYGAQPTMVPTISVEPPRTPQQMDRAVHALVTGRYAWVGFTSVNAVRAVRERIEAVGLDARAFAGVRVAAVGGVTAAALVDWGIRPDLVPSGEQSAAGLLADWPDCDPDCDPLDRVFLPRADIATDTLVAGLGEMGWAVDDVTAYRTVRAAPPPAPIREAIKSGFFDAVVFTSSSTVRNLVGIAGKPHAQTVIACIGPATAKTAEEHGLRVDVLAPEPSSDLLVDALAAHGAMLSLTARQAGQPVRRPSERRAAARRRAR